MSADAAPKAHQVEAISFCGTITFCTPSSRANTPACAGPAPPKANSTKSRGSKPFSTVVLRMMSAILNSAILAMPLAASMSERPSAEAVRCTESTAFFFFVNDTATAEKVVRVDRAEHDVRVGDRRDRAALAVARGSGIGARRLRADRQRLRRRIGARE